MEGRWQARLIADGPLREVRVPPRVNPDAAPRNSPVASTAMTAITPSTTAEQAGTVAASTVDAVKIYGSGDT